jgi:uncharacterized protein (DUF1810 family)
MDDPHNLDRFVRAQEAHGNYERALGELRRGRKESHWMWFIFPQVEGLGRSAMAEKYAIGSLGEAHAYLEHPVLGPRLRECAAAVAGVEALSAAEILGAVDALKLRSSMTLFLGAHPEEGVFLQVIEKYFGGEYDDSTDRLLARHGRR